MTTTRNMSSNITDPIATRAAELAKAANTPAKNRANVAKGKDLAKAARVPAEPITNMDAAMMAAQIAEMRAQFAEIMAQNQALVAQNAVLKAAKPGKAEKTQPQPENEDVHMDGHTLVIRIDTRKDTGKDTASKGRRIVASSGTFGFYNFTHDGQEYGLACNLYRKNPNFEALEKAHKEAKKQAK